MQAAELMIRMVFDRWNSLLTIASASLSAIPDEELLKEIRPGKNRGVYILGHLIAVHDAMLPLLDLGEQQYPDLYEIFVTAPDRSVTIIPAVNELRTTWKNQTACLTALLETLPAEVWFSKQHAVSEEVFQLEPNRNKLNILLTRTSHLSYHVGQLALFK